MDMGRLAGPASRSPRRGILGLRCDGNVRKWGSLVTVVSWCLAVASPALGQIINSSVERLYVLECGQGIAPDQGRFSPGYNEGKPFALAANCYLIRHPQGYLLWSTGVADKFFQTPGGIPSHDFRPNWTRSSTLARQLKELHVNSSDIRYIGIANSHVDHVGNLEMFPEAIVLMQESEWEFAKTQGSRGAPGQAIFNPDHPMKKLEGDYDIFGDGTAKLIATPSVTPGNQSLLVKLRKTGAILLSGDVIHFRYGWDHQIVPTNVWNKEKTLASFKRLTDVMLQNNAELWIEHDKEQSDAHKFSPDYYE
jgi:glyoxylase-like metal-dependent hydrolase (beta-lactamase superfamily II)